MRKENTNKLLNARLSNVKLYWKLLKESTAGQKRCNIGVDKFSLYFKSIDNIDGRFYEEDEEIIYFNNRFLDGELDETFSELDLNITTDEVLKSIKSLNSGKSPDKFLNGFFMHGKEKKYVLTNKSC